MAAGMLAACGGRPNQESPTATTEAPATAETTSETKMSVGKTVSTTQDSVAPVTLTIYSGRKEPLIGPAIDMVGKKLGANTKLEVRYGSSSEMAALILEERSNSPASLFISQDAGSLGAVAKQGFFATLPSDLLDHVEPRFRSPDSHWIGLTGRARTIVYNSNELSESDLPKSILGFTDPKWERRLGWAPTNGSFQAHVTAMRVQLGETATKDWLKGILANKPTVYPKNTPQVAAAGAGEISCGFVNHYYLMRKLAEEPNFPARNHFYTKGDAGALINVAGGGILKSENAFDQSVELLHELLSDDVQRYFADTTYEYPLASGMQPFAGLPELSTIDTPNIDLSNLDDLQGTLNLLRSVDVL